jgi:hypothetical protein
MESGTFRQWLSERGCTFEAGKDTVGTHGHAYVTVCRGIEKRFSRRSGPRSGLIREL